MKVTERDFMDHMGRYFKHSIAEEVSARIKEILASKIDEIAQQVVRDYIKAANFESYEDVRERKININVNIQT